jgi:hypothetical protein
MGNIDSSGTPSTSPTIKLATQKILQIARRTVSQLMKHEIRVRGSLYIQY